MQTWLTQYKGEFVGIREMRKHVAWYTSGYPMATKLRLRVKLKLMIIEN